MGSGVIARLKRATKETFSPQTPPYWVAKLFGGRDTASGVVIDEHTALQYTAVWACVQVIAQDIAKLPFLTYRRLERGRERAREHPVYGLLHDAPNPDMTSKRFREVLQGHVLTWGNGYALIQRDGAGRPVALWPQNPAAVRPKRSPSGDLVYEVEGESIVPARDMLHIAGLGFDGVRGYSPVAMQREALGLGLAAEEYGARLFGAGAMPKVVLKHPGALGPEAQTRLRDTWRELYGGLERAHGVAVLEEGMDVQALSIPPEDAQFLQLRRFQLEEIARWYRVPLHKVQDLERATFSNVEQMAIEYVVDTLQPWQVEWEQECNRKLFLPAERAAYYVELNTDGLLRGDIKSRMEALHIMLQDGVINADEWRELISMNPQPGGQGSMYLVPLNMIPKTQAAQDPPPASTPVGSARRLERSAAPAQIAEERWRLAQSFQPVFADAYRRVLRRERADIMRVAEKLLRPARAAGDDFERFLEEFYREHPTYTEQQFRSFFDSYSRAVGMSIAKELGLETGVPDISRFLTEYVQAFAERLATKNLTDLLAVYREAGESPLRLLELTLDEWVARKPETEAAWEMNRALGAFARESYRLSGVRRLRWVAIGDSCPWCRQLHGRVVGIEQPFAESGEKMPMLDDSGQQVVDDSGQPKFYSFGHRTSHPPAHAGCDCQILPE